MCILKYLVDKRCEIFLASLHPQSVCDKQAFCHTLFKKKKKKKQPVEKRKQQKTLF